MTNLSSLTTTDNNNKNLSQCVFGGLPGYYHLYFIYFQESSQNFSKTVSKKRQAHRRPESSLYYDGQNNSTKQNVMIMSFNWSDLVTVVGRTQLCKTNQENGQSYVQSSLLLSGEFPDDLDNKVCSYNLSYFNFIIQTFTIKNNQVS